MSKEEVSQAAIDAGWAMARARYEDAPLPAAASSAARPDTEAGAELTSRQVVDGWNLARAQHGQGPIPPRPQAPDAAD